MIKRSSKITSLILTLVMIVSLIVVPAQAASELNEITGFIWDVNSITGIKIANSYEDATNVQAVLAVYEGQEVVTVTAKDVQANSKVVTFDSPVTLASEQTAKAFLWNAVTLEPLAKSYPVTNAGVIDSNCQVVGTQTVILPAANATIKAKLNYTLYDSELQENVSAKFSLTGSDLTGLSITEDGVLTTSPQAKAGTVYVNAQYGCNVYQKELTLVKGYYDNFEGYTVDSVPSGHTGSLVKVVEETVGGNKYITAISGYPRVDFTNNLTSDNVTFEYDFKFDANSVVSNPVSLANGIKASGTMYYMALNCTDTSGKTKILIRRQFDENGVSVSYPYKQLATVDDGWVNIKYVLHCDKNTYDMYVNGEKVADNWRVRTEVIESTLIGYSPTANANTKIDNVNVYSGTAYDAYELDGVSTIVAPADNADFTTSLGYALKDVDTNTAVIGAKYSLADNYAGFAMAENGDLTVSSLAEAGSITVKATLGNTTYTKDVKVKKGYYTDFETDTVGAIPSGWANDKQSLVIAEENGNKYVDAVTAYGQIPFATDLSSDSVTVEFDAIFRNVDGTVKGSTVGFNRGYNDTAFSEGGRYYSTAVDTTQAKNADTMTIRKSVDENGNNIPRVAWKDVPFDEWISFKMVLNTEAGTYDLYVDGEKLADDWKFNSVLNSYTLTHLITYGYLDNIRVYSGTRNPSTLFLVGDSIVQSYAGSDARPYPIQGWGYYINDYLSDDVVVDNRARSGWDTDNYLYPDGIYDKENGCMEYGSTIYEGDGTTKKTVSYANSFWENIVSDIKPGDYVMISLAINDNGDKIPQERYVENIETMYNEATAKGATVLFTTPTIHAGSWNSTSAFAENQYWSVYGNSCSTFAQSKGAVCLPLGSTLATLYNDMVADYKAKNTSATDAEAYNYVRNSFHIYAVSSPNPPEGIDSFGDTNKDDPTHFNTVGANKLAGIIANLIKESGSSLGKYVK